MANYDQSIYDRAIKEGFSSGAAKLVVAQARYESADYGSNVFNNNYNMFGMKFVGQELASRGTPAPFSERSATCQRTQNCSDRDFYAKYKSPADSAADVVGRLYRKERKGIGYEQLRNESDPYEYANKLKQRDYYGSHDWSTSEGKAEARSYGAGLASKLKKIQIVEKSTAGGGKVSYALIGGGILLLTGISFWLYKKYKK